MSQIDVTIMGQLYKLACKKDEQAALIQAAAYLDEKMCHFRDTTKIKGTDKIAVMAALTISVQLLATKAPDGPFSELSMAEINTQLQGMNKVLDGLLAPQENLF
ncbi:MAG: cell division protein ZapA [Solimicrobium sp.]|jgi:cell division protein ZapA|nr:cell division protein ZapA [Solimicrobium sp.]